MKCEKTDLRKVNFKKSIVWNIWKQFDVDIEKLKEKLIVRNHYMPFKEQRKLVEYFIENYEKCEYYNIKLSKELFKKTIAWDIINYFPSNTEEKNESKRKNKGKNKRFSRLRSFFRRSS